MTSDSQTYDAAVVGASLAGCTTAILLGRAGLRVALIDKHADPSAYKRLCGHYIQSSATPVFEQLRIAGEIEAAGGVRNGADVWTRWGLIGSPLPPAERPYGYSIRRSKLDPMVRRLALETPGVCYLPRHEVVGLERDDDTQIARVEARDRSGSHARLTARLVVGADGRSSTVAALARARERRAPNERFCYMAYFGGVGLTADPGARVWALDPDYAIAATNDDGITLLAAFPHKRRLPEFRADRARALRELFAALPEPPDVGRAELAGKVVGFKDYGLVARAATPCRGVALVGDAALTSDPLLAIGCGWALQSAAWLADAAAPALAGEDSLDRALLRYRRAHRRRLLGHHRMLVAGARAHRLNPFERLLFKAAVHDPRTAELLVGYLERRVPPRRLLAPGAIARAARAGLTRGRPAAAH